MVLTPLALRYGTNCAALNTPCVEVTQPAGADEQSTASLLSPGA